MTDRPGTDLSEANRSAINLNDDTEQDTQEQDLSSAQQAIDPGYQTLEPDIFVIKTPVYNGPADELIRLALLEKVDLFEVRLGAVIEDFLKFASGGQNVGLEVLTTFIKDLTTLIEIKSRLLLPDTREEELPEELLPTELLERQIAYRRFKNAGQHIASLIEHSRYYVSRDADVEKGIKHHIFSGTIDAMVLKALAERIVNIYNFKVAEAKHMIPTPILLEKFADFVNTKLSSQKKLMFRDLMRELGNKQEILALFLALLNLYKNGEIELAQEELFGDIEIKRHFEEVPAGV